ncbi:Tfp pilus assembly protein PilN [Flavimobilis soli]|uniref:Tfp pilus assembly protein PilN n=1 Tax=Flavimobilis soli TaxID=442709 RepID=A0A2A9EAQ0_9MICO|nr:fimbrial assembly protein [Flavimobilis soli]PFG35641.1 Tfp pilus assembly protein PilN [Flavimobilis soli]
MSLFEKSKTSSAQPTKSAAKVKTGKGALGAPLLPQVDLLPAEIRAGRGFARVKRMLAGVVVLALLSAGGMYLFVQDQNTRADDHLANAQDTATRLAREKAQYGEVTAVLAAINQTQTARMLGMATEVSWKSYLDAITAVLPDDVTITMFEVTNGSPTAPLVAGADPLSTPGVGTVVFVAHSPTLPKASDWLDGLESIPGFSDPTLQESRVDAVDAEPYYEVTSTIQVGAEALAGRTFGLEGGSN